MAISSAIGVVETTRPVNMAALQKFFVEQGVCTQFEDSRHGQEVSFESVKEINPDILFVINRTLAIGGDNSSNDGVLENALIAETPAAKNGKIIQLTPDLWYLSGGGLESTKLMIEDAQKALK